MSKTVRNILSFLILMITSFCVIICAGIILMAKDNVYYDLVYDYPLEIKEVRTEKMGEVYGNQSSQAGNAFYKLDIVLENKTNSTIQKSSVDYTMDVYSGGKSLGYVNRIHDNGMLSYYGSYLIPAGETGLVPIVIEVPDEAENMYIYEWDREDEKIEVELKK